MSRSREQLTELVLINRMAAIAATAQAATLATLGTLQALQAPPISHPRKLKLVKPDDES